MEYIKALIIKLVMITVILWIVLGAFYGVPFGQIFLLSAIITGVTFILGDLFILPKFENWGATIADFLLVFLAVWLYGTNFMVITFPILTAAAISAVLIAVGEIFFHRYVDKHILHVDDSTGGRGPDDVHRHLQTEFGEEINKDTEDPKE